MPLEVKDLHDALPHSLSLEGFLYRDRLYPGRVAAVQSANGRLQLRSRYFASTGHYHMGRLSSDPSNHEHYNIGFYLSDEPDRCPPVSGVPGMVA